MPRHASLKAIFRIFLDQLAIDFDRFSQPGRVHLLNKATLTVQRGDDVGVVLLLNNREQFPFLDLVHNFFTDSEFHMHAGNHRLGEGLTASRIGQNGDKKPNQGGPSISNVPYLLRVHHW